MTIDMHCDLLSHPHFCRKDPAVRCSPEQLLSGGVRQQVCAIFVPHSRGEPNCDKQNSLFFSLPNQYPDIGLLSYEEEENGSSSQKKSLSLIRSIENASALGDDTAPLGTLLAKLIHLTKQGPLAYLGIVWKGDNRFGGGTEAPKRLSNDGKVLLDIMYELGVPIDLSHCSDKLAEDILDYTADKLPNLAVIASHSNFRSVLDHRRNLVDAHAKEIVRRKGVIGLNLVRSYVGDSLGDLEKHVLHAENLGILSSIVLGSDFFYANEDENFFFNECSSAEAHPVLNQLIHRIFSKGKAESILSSRAEKFLKQVIVEQVNPKITDVKL
ncbi:membrane dipeptidase precursor [Chlamydia pneumoniae TW-183]|uniref:Dipeptidase n=2 Tax=Chlamydia pneumoniae TaxID=83558 RepID=Q9Z8R9_CHLPN|nr:dipeptidase [Chlamydia pneumoniae]AAD18418.1 Dipeptidase [Chlamydia pneumoniae CWL029]AAF38320.1 dipeptidase, putative [Chlamydia pneumoniae AR39]AAP98209.1 membrane dipeptidase precursor [Chlamydia pneumoniae TW-183]CRI32769.1 Dipeptidase [Chlamydia pneumoniae]CRI35632.1 Dipeptidase [Chlamydia pneumoniae]